MVCSYAYRGLLRARRGEESMYVLSRMRRRGREESEKDKQSPLGRACDGQRAQTMRVKGATSLATFLAGRSLFFEDFVPLPWTHGKFFSPSEEVDQTVMSITTSGRKTVLSSFSSYRDTLLMLPIIVRFDHVNISIVPRFVQDFSHFFCAYEFD